MSAPDQIGIFHQRVEALARLARPTIAFGLSEPNAAVLDSLRQCASVAEIILVGPSAITGVEDFPLVIQSPAEERIADMLVRGEVDGIIRGTLDDVATRKAYERASGGERFTYSPALLEDPLGRQFFMAPLSNNKGWTAADRLGEARAIAEFVKDWDIAPRIAVYAATRRSAFEASKHMTDIIMASVNQTFQDAEWIVEQLSAAGYAAKNMEVDLSTAVTAGYNVHVPVNGMVGNQIFRVFLFCGGRILAAPLLGLSRLYEDNSREETDYRYHVKWLAALINKRKGLPLE